MAENMHNYEMVVIASADLDEEGLTALNQRVADWIKAGGGTEPQTSVWGRRRLAYVIRKRTDGIYVQYNYQMAPEASRDLDRNLKIDENVIRHMIVRLDEE
jgi:small subunit ribosomal protein S6